MPTDKRGPLDERVTVGGQRGVIVQRHTQWRFTVRLDDGSDVTVGGDKLLWESERAFNERSATPKHEEQ